MGRSKYNVSSDNSDRTYDGIVFASRNEMQFYCDYVLPKLNDGIITGYELQKKYILQPKFYRDGELVRPIQYVADFYLEYADGTKEVIDTKGCPDAVAKVKRKMFWYLFPELTYKWLYYSPKYGNEENGGWCDFEYVEKQRRLHRKVKKLKKRSIKKDEKAD